MSRCILLNCFRCRRFNEYVKKHAAEVSSKFAGIQAKLTEPAIVEPTTFIPTPEIVTNNNADMSIAPNVGQITVNAAGTYEINWIVQSDDDSSVALTINGNMSTFAPVGISLLTLNEGDIIGLMNLGGTDINVTFAQLAVIGTA